MTRLARGLGALIALLGVVVGIPLALLVVGAGTLPSSVPSPAEIQDALTSPDTGGLFVGFLVILGWAAWAYFTVSIVIELASQFLRRPGLQLPGFRWGQSAVGGLVAAVAAMLAIAPIGTASAAAVPITTHSPTVATSTTSITDAPPAKGVPADPATAHAQTIAATGGAAAGTASSDAKAAGLRHTVQSGDSLWRLAERYYGNGEQYTRILAANPHLDSDGFLELGTLITIPGIAAKPDTHQPEKTRQVTVEKGDTLSEIAQSELGHADRWPDIAKATRGITQPDGQRLTNPDLIQPGWKVVIPDAATAKEEPGKLGHLEPHKPTETKPSRPKPQPTRPPTAKPTQQPTQEPTQRATERPTEQPTQPPTQPTQVEPTAVPTTPSASSDHDNEAGEVQDQVIDHPVRTAGGAGVLLCAGILALVGARRQRQLRRRQPGQQIALPDTPARGIEQQMRTVTRRLDRDHLALALRTLSHRVATALDPAMPSLRYAIATQDTLTLHLVAPRHDAPGPFTASTDGATWSYHRNDHDQLVDSDTAAATPPAYPALVALGEDADDHQVLVDLEHIGALTISADAAHLTGILGAIAVELATTKFADDLLVTLVGTHPELPDAIGTDRARHFDTPAELLANITARITADRAHLAHSGQTSAAHARRDEPADWQPEVVLLGTDLTDDEREQLTALLTEAPRVAVAAVTASTTPLNEWAFRMVSPSAAELAPLELAVAPQTLRDEDYAASLQMLKASQRTDTTPAPWWDHTRPMPESEDDYDEPEPQTAPVTTITGWHRDAQSSRATAEAVERTRDDCSGDGAGEQAPVQAPGLVAPEEQTQSLGEERPEPAQADRPHVSDSAVSSDRHDAPGDAGPDSAAVAAEPDSADIVDAAADNAETPAERVPEEPARATVHHLPPAVPSITLFGVPAVHSPAGGTVDPTRIGQLTRAAVYLALYPGRTGGEMNTALSVSSTTRDSIISRLRKWLGETPSGELYLPKLGRRFALHDDIRTDWDHYQELIVGGVNATATVTLVDALRLVTGAPITEPELDKYDYAARDREEITAVVRDTAHELASRAISSGDIEQARWAITQGYIIDAGDELLARDEIRAERMAGNRRKVREIANRLASAARRRGIDLEPATIALLNDIRRAHG